MKKVFSIVLLIVALSSCTREVLVPQGKVIAETTVDSEAGSINVLVTADGIWSAKSISEWIDVDDTPHRGAYVMVLEYGSNRSVEGEVRYGRVGKVLVRSFDGGQCDTVVVNQKGMER